MLAVEDEPTGKGVFKFSGDNSGRKSGAGENVDMHETVVKKIKEVRSLYISFRSYFLQRGYITSLLRDLFLCINLCLMLFYDVIYRWASDWKNWKKNIRNTCSPPSSCYR